MDQSVGKALRAARRRRGLDLGEVETITKIRARFLRALENEEWDVLPGETYARAFIRTYADYLGLDGARLAERHRHDVGADRPGEGLLGPDPGTVRVERQPRPRLSSRTAVLVSLGLVAVLLAIGLSSGEEEPVRTPRPSAGAAGGQRNASPPPVPASPQQRAGLSLSLIATAEVWVCLLGADGEALVDGQILATGAEAGPFRSGSFTVSLGNGEVSMTVNGEQASIRETPSPVGYTIGDGGELRELSDGERPTCT